MMRIDYFNPHFRKGSDPRWWNVDQQRYISIHTSAREVTLLRYPELPATQFQSTLPQGKWRCFYGTGKPGNYFNPHFRKGSDVHCWTQMWLIIRFQSTLPQGKWRRDGETMRADGKFQSTLPQGKWQTRLLTMCWIYNFNPHFRKGSDVNNQHIIDTYQQISIHTSAREVTYNTCWHVCQ